MKTAMRMRQVHDKLVSDAETLRQRREAIQSKMALARCAGKRPRNVMGSHTGTDEMQARRRDRPAWRTMADAMLGPLERDAGRMNETPLDPAC